MIAIRPKLKASRKKGALTKLPILGPQMKNAENAVAKIGERLEKALGNINIQMKKRETKKSETISRHPRAKRKNVHRSPLRR